MWLLAPPGKDEQLISRRKNYSENISYLCHHYAYIPKQRQQEKLYFGNNSPAKELSGSSLEKLCRQLSPKTALILVLFFIIAFMASLSSAQNNDINSLPGVVVLVSPKTALISHQIANRVVARLRLQNQVEFPIRLRKVRCNFAEAVKAIYDMSNLAFKTRFILTDLCPDVNYRLSQVLKFRDTILITASDNNPAFRDRKLYNNTFSILPSIESLSMATYNFLSRNNWKKMLLVYDAHTPASSYYSLIATSLFRNVESLGIEVARPIENKIFENTIGHIQKSGLKIVFLLMPVDEIAEFLCQYLSTTSTSSVPRLAFLVHSDVTDLPLEIVLSETCHDAVNMDLLTAFVVRFAPYDLISNSTTLAKLPQPGRLMCSARKRPRKSGALYEMVTHPPQVNGTSEKPISHYYRCYYYDGLKAIFHTLQTAYRLNPKNPHDSLTLQTSFQNQEINGKTGKIRFNRVTAERLGQVEIVQIANGQPRWIVVFDMSAPGSAASRYYRRVKWPRGRPPLDSVIRRYELDTVPVELLASFSAAALLGIAASIAILITNIRFRNHSYIKMSSPNLNNFILIGSCLCYTNVIFQGLSTSLLSSSRLFEAFCTISTWSLPIGFSLAFGAMLTKTWRVHTIFRHTTGLKRQVIPDSKLIIVIFSFVLLDILLNTLWVLFDPQTRKIREMQTTLADAYETTSQIESCSSQFSLWWTLAMWLPKGALLIYGLYLAWKTKNVRLAALNDSYQIGISIYIIVVLCTIGATSQPIFKTKVIISYCVLSTTLLLCIVIPEVVIFIPKLSRLWKDPLGDQKMLRQEIKAATKSTNRVANELAKRYLINEVKTRRVRNSELSDEVAKVEKQLSQLGDDGCEDKSTTVVATSYAMVTIGAAFMNEQRATPEPNQLTVISDEKDVTVGVTVLTRSPEPTTMFNQEPSSVKRTSEESAPTKKPNDNESSISSKNRYSQISEDLPLAQDTDKEIDPFNASVSLFADEDSTAEDQRLQISDFSDELSLQKDEMLNVEKSILKATAEVCEDVCGDDDVAIIINRQTASQELSFVTTARRMHMSSTSSDIVATNTSSSKAEDALDWIGSIHSVTKSSRGVVVASDNSRHRPQYNRLQGLPPDAQISHSDYVKIYCDIETFL